MRIRSIEPVFLLSVILCQMLSDRFRFFIVDRGSVFILHAHNGFGPFSLIFFLTRSFLRAMACTAFFLKKNLDVYGLTSRFFSALRRNDRQNKESNDYDTHNESCHGVLLDCAN
jgi:hypothetical protein